MSQANNIIDLINAGVRAENLRQKAISSNFANLETPGYRRVDVTFKELLDACSGKSESGEISNEEFASAQDLRSVAEQEVHPDRIGYRHEVTIQRRLSVSAETDEPGKGKVI